MDGFGHIKRKPHTSEQFGAGQTMSLYASFDLFKLANVFGFIFFYAVLYFVAA
jgi:hypothetical protein